MSRYTWAIVILIAIIAFQSIVQGQNSPKWYTFPIDPNGYGGSVALDSNGNPHVAFIHWDYTKDAYGAPAITRRVDYAVLRGNHCEIQTVDYSGNEGILKLDSADHSHIIYSSSSSRDYFLKYAVLKDGNWSTQTIGSSEQRIIYSMALDSEDHPHVIYTTYNYDENYFKDRTTQNIKYAAFNGESWDIQTVDRVNSSVGFNKLSVALDSKGNPKVIYLENTQFPYSSAVSNYNYLDCYNVKYAYLSNDRWQRQTLFTNATNISNLVLDSDEQPRFCYQHNSYFINVEYGSYGTNSTSNYAYLNAQEWLSQPINTQLSQSGKTFLHLDSREKPQVFFYTQDYYNSNNSGLMYVYRIGLNWNLEELGSIPYNSTYYFNTEIIADMAFDSHGNPVLMVEGQAGSIRGATLMGGLTYATVETLSASPFANNWIIIPIAIAVIIALICLLIIHKKRTII